MPAPPPLLVVVVVVVVFSTTASSGETSKASNLLHVGSLPTRETFSFSSSSSDNVNLASLRSSLPSSLLLHHINSLLPTNTTPSDLFDLLLRRDSSRFTTLLSILNTACHRKTNRTHHSSGGGSFSSGVVSGLSHGSGEYFTKIGIGTPPTYAFTVLDTGSDVVWVQCAPCRKCYAQNGPIFDPTKSTTYRNVKCGSATCRQLDTYGCDRKRNNTCVYQVAYGDGSVTTGDFSTETVTFLGGFRIGGVSFGCGHDNEGLFVAAAGLLGLGRGKLSFPSQAGRRGFGRRFAYCLVDRTSAVAPKEKASTITFGNSAIPKSRTGTIYTPLLTNPRLDTFYYVGLVGISVGGRRLPGVISGDLQLNHHTGRGGVIIDSGTSVTRLARPAYVALRDAFRSGAGGLKPAKGFSLFDTCFDLSGMKEVKVPTVVLHFGRVPRKASSSSSTTTTTTTSDMALPAANYLIPVDTSGVFCFAFAGTDSGISIIGNIQQQGFRVVFDSARSRIGFTPHSC